MTKIQISVSLSVSVWLKNPDIGSGFGIISVWFGINVKISGSWYVQEMADIGTDVGMNLKQGISIW